MIRVGLIRRIVTRRVIVNDNDDIYRFSLDLSSTLNGELLKSLQFSTVSRVWL